LSINQEDEVNMDRERVQRCLEVVAAYRASGQKAKEWAAANGVPERVLASWCAHSRRWQARLDGVSAAPSPQAKQPNGFVAARVAPNAAPATVHVEVSSGLTRLDLHWPLAHTRELAALVRELVR
jgi:hypothetical protein